MGILCVYVQIEDGSTGKVRSRMDQEMADAGCEGGLDIDAATRNKRVEGEQRGNGLSDRPEKARRGGSSGLLRKEQHCKIAPYEILIQSYGGC